MDMANYVFPIVLQEKLEGDIVNGRLMDGQEVSLNDLQNLYTASLADLNKVVRGAVRKGLLVKNALDDRFVIHGKCQPKIISVFQHAAKSGFSPQSVVRAVEILPANPIVAHKLQLRVGEPVFRQTRTRLVNGEVIANQNNYIPIEVCPGLETVDLSLTSFQTVLEGRFNAVVCDIRERFEIASGAGEDFAILGIEPGSEILIVERLSLGSTGLPLVWADIHVRIDRYHYVQELWPEAAAVLDRQRGSK